MKFKFSLAPVLKVREHQEKIQKQKLAEQVSRKQEISDLQHEVQGKLRQFLNDSEKQGAETIHLIRQRSAHLEQVHQKMEKLSEELSQADIKVSEERSKLAAAHKKLHILEKVREFEKGLFSDQVAQNEQKFMDEIATQSFSR
jgi:flagellar FliJ protein